MCRYLFLAITFLAACGSKAKPAETAALPAAKPSPPADACAVFEWEECVVHEGCRYLAPSCAEDAPAEAPPVLPAGAEGCYPAAPCELGVGTCPDGRVCLTVRVDNCFPEATEGECARCEAQVNACIAAVR